MLTQSRLKELLHYDPSTGDFTNRSVRGRVRAGEIAGWWCGECWRIRLGGTTYLAHRLAWFYMAGKWPSGEIDHKDGRRANNAFANLREATSSQNGCNSNHAVGISGSRGVYPNSKGGLPWRAAIQIGGRQIGLGVFDSIEEASAAYRKAAELYHGEFALHNRPKPFERRI